MRGLEPPAYVRAPGSCVGSRPAYRAGHDPRSDDVEEHHTAGDGHGQELGDPDEHIVGWHAFLVLSGDQTFPAASLTTLARHSQAAVGYVDS